MAIHYKRIMIFGRPGSGKSTFAHKLHQITGIPLYHLDKYFFIENWIERDYEEFLAMQHALVAQESWIIDGNATRSLHIRWLEADLVLYLNYPRWVCYLRIYKRLIARRIFGANKTKAIDDRAENCQEQVAWKLLKYMYSFDERVRSTIYLMQEISPTTEFYEIHSDAELKELMSKLNFN